MTDRSSDLLPTKILLSLHKTPCCPLQQTNTIPSMKDEFHPVSSKVINAALPQKDTQERQVQLCFSAQQWVKKAAKKGIRRLMDDELNIFGERLA